MKNTGKLLKTDVLKLVNSYLHGSEACLQNEKVLGTSFCPIYIGPLILKMVKHVVMSMHVCICC